jgi:hypothetical protein
MALPDLEIGVDAYATIAHVEAWNPTRTFNTTLKPTRLAVSMYLRDAFRQINAELAVLGYDVPIGSGNSTSLSVVRHINCLAGAYQAEFSRFSAGNAEFSNHAENLRQRFLNTMDMLRQGKMSIPGATRNSGTFIHKKDEREPTSQFDVDTENNERDPIFTRNMKF